MRFLQVICAVRDGQVLPLRALLAAALVCCLWATASVAAPQGGVPSATWQDNDRNHRRSPNQIVTQLRTPQAQAGQMPLADDAQDQRAAKARNQLAAGEAPVAQDGQLNMLGPDDWRLKILSAAVTNSDMVLLGGRNCARSSFGLRPRKKANPCRSVIPAFLRLCGRPWARMLPGGAFYHLRW